MPAPSKDATFVGDAPLPRVLAPEQSAIRPITLPRQVDGYRAIRPNVQFNACIGPFPDAEGPVTETRTRTAHFANLAPKPKRQRTLRSNASQEVLERSLAFLRDDYQARSAASDLFPPNVSPRSIRESMGRYEDELANASARGLCASCGMEVPAANVLHVVGNDPILVPLVGSLDSRGLYGNRWSFCSSCHNALIRNVIPKFSGKNLVNVTLCQHYPSVLEDLTPVEECLIARSHPLGVILKLRPGGRSSPISYRALQGHFIVIPQDPIPLLDVLPSPELRLHNLIRVFWLGQRRPSNSALNPFLSVRKSKVLAALEYLLRHNHLYTDVVINRAMVDDWSDDFIPTELRDSIVFLDESDHQEREGYTVHLQPGNFENDLQAAQGEAASDNEDGSPLITGSVSTDINGERQDPDLRMLDTLFTTVSSRPTPPAVYAEHPTRPTDRSGKPPMISYTVHGTTTLLDHWKDPSFFTAAFPTLFPTGIGGHLEDRDIPVSLDAFAQWALTHHSKR